MSDYYMHSNEEKHTLDKYGVSKKAREFPGMCVIAFSYVCNARCPACPYTISDIRDNYRDMPFIGEDTFKLIADQCGENKSYMRITGGGEPMLHPKALELIGYAKQKGVGVGLITNGSFLDEYNARKLLESNIDAIEFSVDAADEDTYSTVRVGLDWNTLVNNVERTVKLRNEIKSNTKIIVSAISQKGVDLEAVEKFWGPKVDLVQLRKYLIWGRGDIDKAGDTVPYLGESVPCPHIFDRLNIDTKGRVTVCGYDIDLNYIVGNIFENTISEIWLGKEMSYYRDMHLAGRMNELELCRNCTDKQYRSWSYNYWKIMEKAEQARIKRDMLNNSETE